MFFNTIVDFGEELMCFVDFSYYIIYVSISLLSLLSLDFRVFYIKTITINIINETEFLELFLLDINYLSAESTHTFKEFW